MRLWHKDLIDVLPKNQLVSQWRELLAIKGSIDKKVLQTISGSYTISEPPKQAENSYAAVCENKKKKQNEETP
ncbi:hypothetical protein BGU20_18325 [Clostridioides difficile]|uniref:pyrimidine dimer DNA glycosylase/endonuclease V n=1 Tax=Clostridioides difficile TaxID=1496 RepID=UPI000BC943B6|nr:pyrimidine dimer DNA glycosylase/endonuclease V [Clostridioides difficile]PBE36349.1 hypothetical protein BGU20_18325 [Clostridioides difficile]